MVSLHTKASFINKYSILFLQAVVVLAGVVALVIGIRIPLTEGRAENLDLFSIYSDPFIIYGYVAVIPFFIALYKLFRLLGLIRENQAFSAKSLVLLRHIRYCALAQGVLIGLAGVLIRLFHDKSDDPAGFLALCFGAVFISLVIAAAVSVFEKIVQNGRDIQSDKDPI